MKALVIEDNQMLQKVHKLMLENFNCQVDVAHNAREAFKLFEQHHYEIALVDIGLPDISGIEIARLFRKHDSSIRIIMTSASITDKIKDKCAKAGSNIFLPKPLNLNLLKQEIGTVEASLR
jgi:DNA-binding response OmpR family regulator